MGRSGAEGGQTKLILPFIIEGQVRLRQFLGRALRLAQSRGRSAAARTGWGPALRPSESFVYPPLRTTTSHAYIFSQKTRGQQTFRLFVSIKNMITLYNHIFLKKIEINCHKTHYPSSKFFNFIRTFQKLFLLNLIRCL